MSKTRRQRALEHPGMPKQGVRDPNRVKKDTKEKNPAAVALGKMGGDAPHKVRGLAAASKTKRMKVTLAGNLARWKAKQPTTEVVGEEPVVAPVVAPVVEPTK